MNKREELHSILVEILGSRNVYFQPPANVCMKYPAIVYSRVAINNTFANNDVYNQRKNYKVTVIDPDPDSEIVGQLSKLPNCRYDTHYTAENLNHDVFILNY